MADDNLYAIRESEEGSLRYIKMNGLGTKDNPFTMLSAGDISNPLAVAMGVIDGVSGENKAGWNEDMQSNVRADVWSGTGDYPFPDTPDMTHISQKVDQATMRGASVVVAGLDSNWDAVIQTVVLDADDTTTPVALDTPMIRHNRSFITVLVRNEENITIHNAANNVDYMVIPYNNNHSSGAIYSVPRGYTAYLTQYYCDVAHLTNRTPNSVLFFLEFENVPQGMGFITLHVKGIGEDGAGITQSFNPYAGAIKEMSDIKIAAEPQDSDAFVTAGFDLILIDNASITP